jgi:hypothetical protein
MANEAYTSVINTDALVVPVKAATIYAAEESSLFLGGQLIPIVNAPNGVLQVPELASVTATTLSTEADPGVDLDALLPADTKNTLTCDLIAARSVLRDLGNIDPAEIGRVLGNAVATAFDKSVYTALDGATASTADCVPLSVADIFDAVAQIRSNGETGPLFGVLTPTEATTVLKEIGTAAYAGSDMFQAEALRSGMIGSLAGTTFFVSSNITTANTAGYIFGRDAARIAMQKNVDVEIGRRVAAVGNDICASLHAKAGLIDAGRAVKLVNV